LLGEEGSADFLNNNSLANFDLIAGRELGSLGNLDLVEKKLPESRLEVNAGVLDFKDVVLRHSIDFSGCLKSGVV
jgi:hypothetical protein